MSPLWISRPAARMMPVGDEKMMGFRTRVADPISQATRSNASPIVPSTSRSWASKKSLIPARAGDRPEDAPAPMPAAAEASLSTGTSGLRGDHLPADLPFQEVPDAIFHVHEGRQALDVERTGPGNVDGNVAEDAARTGAHHDHAVGEVERFADLMGDEQDG